MRERPRLTTLHLALLPFATACIQSVHKVESGGPPPPGGTLRVLDERAGHGRPVVPGDRIRVDLRGTYAGGEVWGEGPLTFIWGSATYPDALLPVQVGSSIRMQYLTSPNDTTVRLHPFGGEDTKNEAYQLRRDRGPIIIEHTVRSTCHPFKLYLMQTGFGPIEFSLGCWTLPRGRPGRVDPRALEIQRRSLEAETGETAAQRGAILDPAPAARAPADTARYLGADGLHRAAREGRPEIAGWLIRRGRSVSAVDSFGFQPIHYVGWAQRPLERYVAAFEQSYLDVLDTLLAHGAAVNARVEPGLARAPTMPEREHEGQTALHFAGWECADRLVRRLLERGADPNMHGVHQVPPIAGAAINGCPESVQLLLEAGAAVNADPHHSGTPVQRLAAASAFHQGHYACAELLVKAGAETGVAAERLADRLDDPGPGSFGFANRPMARRVLRLLRAGA